MSFCGTLVLGDVSRSDFDTAHRLEQADKGSLPTRTHRGVHCSMMVTIEMFLPVEAAT